MVDKVSSPQKCPGRTVFFRFFSIGMCKNVSSIQRYMAFFRCSLCWRSVTIKNWKNQNFQNGFFHKIFSKSSWNIINNISKDSPRPFTFIYIFRIFLGCMADFLQIFKEMKLSKFSIDCNNPSVWGTELVVWCFIIFNSIPIHSHNISQIGATFGSTAHTSSVISDIVS